MPGEDENGASRAGRPKQSLTQRSLIASLWLFWGSGVQMALRMAVLAVLARLLEPGDFGLVAAASIVIEFFRVFTQVGVGPAVVQRPSLDDRHVRTAFALSLYLGAALAALVYWSAPLLAHAFFRMDGLAPFLRATSLLLPIQAFSIVADALLQRELRFERIVRIEVLSYVVGYAAVGIGGAAWGLGAWALIAATLGQAAVHALLAIWFRPHPKSLAVDDGAARELLVMGGGFAAARLGNYAALSGDNWVVGRWLGQEALGLYKYAYELTGIPATLFGQVLDRVMFSAMARVQHDPRRLAASYESGVALLGALTLPLSALLFVLAPEIVDLLLGPKWDGLTGPFRVLALMLLFRTTYKMSDSVARATGAVYSRAWRQAVFAALVIGFSWIGQRYGLVEVALGASAAILANFLLMGALTVRVAGVPWSRFARAHASAFPLFLATLAAAEAAAAAARAAGWPAAAVLAPTLAACALALGPLLLLAPRLLIGRACLAAVQTLVDGGGPRYAPLRRSPLLRRWLGPLPKAAGGASGALAREGRDRLGTE
jgi:PST family polysaccharide transporter